MFSEKKHFLFQKIYFPFENTFTFVCKLKSFRFKIKNDFTFVWKTASLRNRCCKRLGSHPKQSIKPCFPLVFFSQWTLIIHKPDN